MVLKLRELLIKKVAVNLSSFSLESCQYLTSEQCNRIFQWLTSHDQLVHDTVLYIKTNLLSVPLYSLEFYKCQQLTNDMLIEFAKSSHLNRLKSLIIHQCNQVRGKLNCQ